MAHMPVDTLGTPAASSPGGTPVPAPVVLVAEELSPAGIAMLESSFEVRHTDGADRDKLLAALADVDAVIVRSATQIDAEAIAAGRHLRVVARAGVGLDNVDVEAATKAGVMVVNAPASNVVSAAEHAVALLLSLARNVPQAMAALKNGQWKRAAYTGVELQDKVAGILGLGRIGALVAERLAAFDMTVIAYDPYSPQARSTQLGVRMVSLDELLAESDFISVHLPRNAETLGIIGDRELHLVKPGVRIINAARGGIVDEVALAVALQDGTLAGAAMDVFSTEPVHELRHEVRHPRRLLWLHAHVHGLPFCAQGPQTTREARHAAQDGQGPSPWVATPLEARG